MRRCSVKFGGDADQVRLRPADIAILVFATERLVHTMLIYVAESMPRNYIGAVTNAAARRIDWLIEELEKSRDSGTGDELIVPMRVGDRQFFAEVLCGYCKHARGLIWTLSPNSPLSEEDKKREEKLDARFSDIFHRLGGNHWNPDA